MREPRPETGYKNKGGVVAFVWLAGRRLHGKCVKVVTTKNYNVIRIEIETTGCPENTGLNARRWYVYKQWKRYGATGCKKQVKEEGEPMG